MTWEELAALGPNWNGYDAVPIPREVVDRARELYERLPSKPLSVVPVPSGTIQFEWWVFPVPGTREQVSFEVEITVDGYDEGLYAHYKPDLNDHGFEDVPGTEEATIAHAARVMAFAGAR